MNLKIYDTIIIGAGPAGMTTALNILRGGKTCLLIEEDHIGGQAALSTTIENIPGIKSINGADFSQNLFDQVIALGADFEFDSILNLTKNLVLDQIEVVGQYNTYRGRTVVIATGASHILMGLENESRLIGHGISYCATCDGAFYKGKDVAIIGDANSALQYALALSVYCKSVTICALFDKLFADDILIKKVLALNNVNVIYNISLNSFIGENNLTGLLFTNTKTKDILELKVEGVFIAIGQKPNTANFKKITIQVDNNLSEMPLLMSNKNYLNVSSNMEVLNNRQAIVPAIYAVGDCTDKILRQVQTACNDGAVAAFSILKYLHTKD